MEELRNLNTKDKMLIMKAVADIATKIYKDNTDFTLNQILKNGKYESKFGQFYKSTTDAKIVAETITKKKKDIAKLQAELAELETLDMLAIYTEEQTKLMSKHTATADNIANNLIADLIDNLDSKRIAKSASKVKRG